MLTGQDSRFTLEQNIGWSLLGDQQTSWLFLETNELSELGITLTYCADQSFLLRLVLGITNDDAKNFSPQMPLYVEEKEGPTHISVDETTKQRSDLRISFRKQNPIILSCLVQLSCSS